MGAIQKNEEQLQKRLMEIEKKLAFYEQEIGTYKSEQTKLKKRDALFRIHVIRGISSIVTAFGKR